MKRIIKRIPTEQGLRRYGSNTLWLLSWKILRMAFGLFVGVWMAKYLGAEKFGLFNYVQSFVGLFIAISTLGLDNIVIRELVKNKNAQKELLGTTFILRLTGALLLLLILCVVIYFWSKDTYTNYMIFIIASTAFFQSFNVIDFYFQSEVLSKYVVYANITSIVISNLLKIILIISSAKLIMFAWVVLFDSIILALGLLYFYAQKVSSFKVSDFFIFNKSIAVNLLKDCWPLILSGIILSIYAKIDQVMIKEIMDTKAVGQYAVAVKLSEMWCFIPSLVVSSLFPAILNAKQQSEKLYLVRLQKLYDLMVWIAIAIAILITFFGGWMVDILYGNQYNDSIDVLTIHIWSVVFAFLGITFNKFLIAENLTKKSLYRTLLGVICNISLNFLLIPKFGIRGAAFATLLSQFVTNYGYDFFDKDLHSQLVMKTNSFFLIKFFRGYK